MYILFDWQGADEVELQGHSEVGSGEKATRGGEDVSPVTAVADAPPVTPDTSSIPANLRVVNLYSFFCFIYVSNFFFTVLL